MFLNSPESKNSQKDDFWDKFRTRNESGRSLLYRYEYEGVLVYDCYSRLSTEANETYEEEKKCEINPQARKEIENASEYGNRYIDQLQYFHMKEYTAQRRFVPQYTLVAPSEHTLKFNSKFESGNLHKAIKVNERTYAVVLFFSAEL